MQTHTPAENKIKESRLYCSSGALSTYTLILGNLGIVMNHGVDMTGPSLLSSKGREAVQAVPFGHS